MSSLNQFQKRSNEENLDAIVAVFNQFSAELSKLLAQVESFQNHIKKDLVVLQEKI